MLNRKAAKNDYELILELWERSVIATHHFLAVDDRLKLKEEIPSYFPNLDVRLWYIEDQLIGFSGVHQSHLEMLFLDPDLTGKGYGTQMIRSLIEDYGVTSVDVNKDNENATRFYLKSSFTVVSEKPTDGEGRPYPILNLKLKSR
ncbi:GNAT family N-acetyltransferase [Paenibacillus sp. GM2]|uniref:GNAT family N-acetyltransferase n=1 Tax=Paenibacillus sp. GM2 TaxID=1622070 RepID=UPI000837B700|nr:GNAT family N-acetyltransferase [Paenibacillus sp. GM2]